MRQLLAVILAVVLSTAVFGTIYVVAQQVERQGAADTPERLASQVAAEEASGGTATIDSMPTVDLARSDQAWVLVVDGSGHVTAGTATLDGDAPRIPAGVLATARADGRDAVTWQARAGLRFATVELRAGDAVVVAGESLAPSEDRTDRLGILVLLAWAVTTAVAVAGVLLVARWPRSGAEPTAPPARR